MVSWCKLKNLCIQKIGVDAESTHPTIAMLGHPLFGFAGKRGFEKVGYDGIKKKIFLHPLSASGEERVGKRSGAGVSRLLNFFITFRYVIYHRPMQRIAKKGNTCRKAFMAASSEQSFV